MNIKAVANEPVYAGLIALLIRFGAPRLGVELPPEVTLFLDGLAATMAGIVLRSNAKGPLTASKAK